MASGSARPKAVFIITGISGAGKSQALKCFEDFGFNCVDNLPLGLLPRFAEILRRSPRTPRVALGIDIREGGALKGMGDSVRALRAQGFAARVLFLDASDRALVRRFSETRHRHPLGVNTLLAIRQERKILSQVKAISDKVIDTSEMTLGELKENLSQAMGLKRAREMTLSVVSFGYKYGLPLDADVVMDVRFLPNPHYEPALRPKSGLHPAVRRYLLAQPGSRNFLTRFTSLVKSLLPHYIHEGKSYLTIAVGCTGGRHRSVCVARHLARELEKGGYGVREFHRDIQR